MATHEAMDRLNSDEIADTMGVIKRMLLVGGLLVAVGYVLVLVALTQEFTTTASILAEDSMKMWLKFGGLGHILLGIFVSLVAIVRTLSLVPHRLAYTLEE